MAGRVVVVGSINTDLVVYVQRLPAPGETVSGGTYASFPGGKGATQAVAASRAGAAVRMVGCLGDDDLGRARLASLAATGIDASGVRLVPGVHSGVAQITVDAEGENTIAVAPGANACVDADVDLGSPADGETSIALFQNEIPQEAAEALVVSARASGWTVAWNLAPTFARRPTEAALRATDWLVCNRKEIVALAGLDGDPVELARLPLSWGARRVLVTLGREGSILVDAGGAVTRTPAFPVTAVDTVGAGDCFCGVLAASLAQGLAVPAALRRASAAAALSTTRRGAQTSMPTAMEIDAFLAGR